ncbi:hypothetical protein F5888DRAFT_234305 [Russula emetica]|nr:hypothetical protein F5888DRAFT_234305 [Russula emetica]
MSDIRLHTLRNSRTRNGYAGHDSSRQQYQSSATASTTTSANLSSGSHPGGSPMPFRAPLNTTIAAAAASSSSSSSFTSARRNKGRRRNEYGDGEPEEEATLLGEGERDPGFLHDDEEERGRTTGVERVHEAASQRSTLRKGSKDRSRTVPLRPPDKLQSKFPTNIVRNQKYNNWLPYNIHRPARLRSPRHYGQGSL